jgi:hypothetical protein
VTARKPQVVSGTSWWDLHGLDAGTGENGVERGGELAGAVADEEPDGGSAVVDVNQQVASLLGGPGSSRMAGCPEDVHVAASHLEGEEHVDPLQCQSAVAWCSSVAG